MRVAALAVVLAMVIAGCGGGGGGGGGSEGADLSGASFTVGSKDFTEQLILGELTTLVLEDAGASVDYQQLAGTDAVRQALVNGNVDMYWEYVGTGWINHLGETSDIPDPAFETVAERDLEENNVHWLGPAGFSNSYAIATNQETAEEYGIETVSDIQQLTEENPEEAGVCVGTEFSSRDDGLPGLQETYGFEFPNIARVQDGVVYELVAAGEECNFGSVFTTDGRIPNLDLVLLEDDEGFFPAYDAALTMRQEAYEENGEQVEEVFQPIFDELTLETMQELNARVDVEGEFPEDVAEDWLTENNFIG